MSSLFCENLRPEPFPNINGKFIDRGSAREQGDACTGVRPAIKILSDALIWNCSHAAGNVRWSPDCSFFRAQKSFGKSACHECSGAGLRLNIAFRMKFREGEPYGGS